MEAAAASLLEGLAPFIGHLTRDALLKFFKARVALRTSVFRTPLDQLARDLIKSDPFSVKLLSVCCREGSRGLREVQGQTNELAYSSFEEGGSTFSKEEEEEGDETSATAATTERLV